MRFSNSGFFHESIVHRPLRNPTKYFRQIFCFRGNIRVKRFFSSRFTGNHTRRLCNLGVTIPRNCATSVYCECKLFFLTLANKSQYFQFCLVWQFLGIVTQRLIDFRVTIPGNRSISGYSNLEINQYAGIVISPRKLNILGCWSFWYFIVYLLKTTSTYHSVKTISLNNKCRYVGETK